jgi:hypothetical protein
VPPAAPLPLDRFLPDADVRERFELIVEAPAAIVMDAAKAVTLDGLPAVRGIFRLRAVLMGAEARGPRPPQGLLADSLAMGWGLLDERPERLVVVGSRCQPWVGDVRFVAIPPAEFAAYDEPGQVKIAWTLETDPLGPERTRFAHETRAHATDAAARAQFLRYWRWARFGIVAIRYLLLPAVRRSAEARWAETGHRRGR